MTPLELKIRLEQETGLKLSMKVCSLNSSMRGYVRFVPRKSKGVYPLFDFHYCRELTNEMPGTEPRPNYFSTDSIHFYFGNEAYNYVSKRTSDYTSEKVKNVVDDDLKSRPNDGAEKHCKKCKSPLKNRRKKYCSDSCKYWYNLIRKENESHLPPARKRTRDYFLKVVGSEWAKGSSTQGKRTGSMVMGSMAAMVRCTVEEVAPVTKENLIDHFKGIPGFTPTGIRLGDQTWVKKQDVEEVLGVKL